MSRCVICDYCDTAGSVSTTTDRAGQFVWSAKDQGFVCSTCRFEDQDDEVLDDEFDKDEV